ncbi:PspA/IM30 family protein [Frankia sp. Mgl5]|uniref:PspA/IM30 family protein n=1 Tax=Frankia sp. Mgl5 TaxID=2933793 RepID=UPI002010C70F|nr:PspA/IM30 family protein [Frankia sp. Mgl5]MCK9928360.1 PspA/IM30 family protein [Frankia sp. Mgl5]
MANVVRKYLRYLSKRAEIELENRADPRVQIDQAIEAARQQHEKLVSQAALVVGNQREIEMKMGRQVEEVTNLTESARSALMLADNARAAGDLATAVQYEQTAQAFASKLIASEAALEDLKVLHEQAAASAAQARVAVEDNTARMHRQLAERTRLLTQIEHAAMHEQMSKAMEGMSSLPPAGDTPTLAEVRDKVEKRYAVALGRQELASQGMEARMLEVRRATMDAQAAGRLAELRGSMAAGHGAGAPGQTGRPAMPPMPPTPGISAGRVPGGTGDERLSLGKAAGDSAPSRGGGTPPVSGTQEAPPA